MNNGADAIHEVPVAEPQAMDGGYRLLFEYDPLPLWVLDAQSLRFLAVNQAAINQYGYSPDEFCATTIETLWHEPEQVQRNIFRPITDPGIASAGVWKHRRKDDSTLDVEIVYTGLKFGQRDAWLVLAPDVTRLIDAQLALAESKRRLQSLFESPAMGVVHWGHDGDILDANDTFLQILGHTRSDLEQGRVLWQQIAPLPPADAEAGRVLSGTVRPLVHRQYLRPDGNTISVLVAAAEWPNRGGMAFVIDVTHRVQLEAQLRHWQKMEAIGRIAGGISHDCNNFLTVILGYAEILLCQPDISPKARAAALEIQRSGDRAAALMQQLLSFGRQEMLAPGSLRLNDVVADMEQMLRCMVGETLKLNLLLDHGVDSIFADHGRIEQLIVNLIVNARDATPAGGEVTLRTANAELGAHDVAHWPECEPGHYVTLSVQDTGAGMTDEVQSHIFEPFFTTKERGRGTGLGLAIVSDIVRQCRGHIAVASQVGRGTTFTVYLPRATHSAPQPPRASAPAPLAKGCGIVLLVEDDPSVRRLIEATLLSCGYQVRVAADGCEALRCCDDLAAPPRLVLTDVVMPQMGGRHLGEQIRVRFPETKVLYMTGYDDPAADCATALRADDVILRKPFSPGDLSQAVRRMLDDPAAN